MDGLIEHFGYLAVFGLLLAAGVGLPFPEEVTQIAAGVLAHQQALELWKVLVVAWIGVVAGDSAIFFIGRRHGERVLSTGLAVRALPPARRERLRTHFEQHALLTIAVARHLSGLRGPAFALAGALGVPFRTMLLGDGLSALLSVPVAVGLGFLFSRHVLQLERDMRVIEVTILAVIAIGAALAWARARRRAAVATGPDRTAPEGAERQRPAASVARLVLVAFLATFLAARTLVYLIMSHRLPNLTVHEGGTHVHHLNFGIFLLAGVGGVLLFLPASERIRRAAAVLYGIALALTFDEFGMWLHLGGGYWQRSSFDAVVVIAATLGLLAAAPELRAFRRVHWWVTAVLGAALLAFGLLVGDGLRTAEDRWWPSLQALDLKAPP